MVNFKPTWIKSIITVVIFLVIFSFWMLAATGLPDCEPPMHYCSKANMDDPEELEYFENDPRYADYTPSDCEQMVCESDNRLVRALTLGLIHSTIFYAIFSLVQRRKR